MAVTARPLVICDVDEVVLHFLDPFDLFLRSRDHHLVPESFRLTGNIRHLATGEPLDAATVDIWQEDFFADQENWQVPVEGAAHALEDLAREADIMFLTAMPPRHENQRRRLLDRHGLIFPMIATEDAKGPVVKRLGAGNPGKTVFLDDIFTNHHSVRAHAPDTFLIHLMANDAFRKLSPDPGEDVAKARDWNHAHQLIRTHFGL